MKLGVDDMYDVNDCFCVEGGEQRYVADDYVYYVGSMSVCSFLTLSSHTACRDSAPALSLRANPVDPSKLAQLICPHEGVYFKSDNFQPHRFATVSF